MTPTPRYLEATQDAGRDFVLRGIPGEVVMLNLLRFREVADYSATPELEPEEPVSGREAYRRYMDHTLPFLEASGGSLDLVAEGGGFLIGPPDERWDLVLLVRHRSVETFLAFARNEAYQDGMGHRTAALEDSRLLPLAPTGGSGVRAALGGDLPGASRALRCAPPSAIGSCRVPPPYIWTIRSRTARVSRMTHH